MKNLLLILCIFFSDLIVFGQSKRIAILDFENISGIAKYDGLGKAMSSMLISDIEANVSPKRLQLIERSQLQKVLKEQNLQSSGNVNKNTAVKTGKILGVNYILVGDVYILNDQLIINARLTNTETGDIIFSKKQEGKLLSWLNLKTNIAKDIAASFSQPFTEPTIPDNNISLATITTYGNAITAKDKGDTSLADKLVETIQEFSPDFKYVEDLKKEIIDMKIQISKNSEDIVKLNDEIKDNVTDYLLLGNKYRIEKNFINAEKYLLIGINKLDKVYLTKYLLYKEALSSLYFEIGNYEKSLKHANDGLSIYPFFKEFLYYKYKSLFKLNKLSEFDKIKELYNSCCHTIDICNLNDSIFNAGIVKYTTENNLILNQVIKNNLGWKQDYGYSLLEGIFLNEREYYFNSNFKEYKMIDLITDIISEEYEDNPNKILTFFPNNLLEFEITYNLKSKIAWFTMLSGDIKKSTTLYNNLIVDNFANINYFRDFNSILKTYYQTDSRYPDSVSVLEFQYFNSNIDSLISIDKSNYFRVLDTVNKYILIYHFYYYGTNGTNSFGPKIDTIKLNKLENQYWLIINKYHLDQSDNKITVNPIIAYYHNLNSSFPLESILYCIKESNLITWPTISEEKKMDIINWAHSYLLSGDYITALKIYKLFNNDFTFNNFGNLNAVDLIKKDLVDFKDRNLISSDVVFNIINKL